MSKITHDFWLWFFSELRQVGGFLRVLRSHVYSEYNSWFHGVRFRHVFLYIHISFLLDSCCAIFNFLSNVLQITFCPFVLFRFAIVLSVVLQVTASVVSVVFTIFSQFYWWRKHLKVTESN
jgi:hypothetical protein